MFTRFQQLITQYSYPEFIGKGDSKKSSGYVSEESLYFDLTNPANPMISLIKVTKPVVNPFVNESTTIFMCPKISNEIIFTKPLTAKGYQDLAKEVELECQINFPPYRVLELQYRTLSESHNRVATSSARPYSSNDPDPILHMDLTVDCAGDQPEDL